MSARCSWISRMADALDASREQTHEPGQRSDVTLLAHSGAPSGRFRRAGGRLNRRSFSGRRRAATPAEIVKRVHGTSRALSSFTDQRSLFSRLLSDPTQCKPGARHACSFDFSLCILPKYESARQLLRRRGADAAPSFFLVNKSFAEELLAPDAIERNQDQRLRKHLRWNRRMPSIRIQLVEPGLEAPKRFVRPNRCKLAR